MPRRGRSHGGDQRWKLSFTFGTLPERLRLRGQLCLRHGRLQTLSGCVQHRATDVRYGLQLDGAARLRVRLFELLLKRQL